MPELYTGIAGSPITQLVGDITDTQVTIAIADDSALPDAPNLCTIGYGEQIETIRYSAKSNGVLQDVTRGIEGTPRAWQSGTEVARFFTAYDHNAIIGELKDARVSEAKEETFENIGARIEESETDLATHQAENSAKHIHSSGSNADGEWIKFDNGWMICTHILTTTSTEQETHGALYFIRYPQWTFPQPFAAPPSVSSSGSSTTTQITANRGVNETRVLEFYGYRGGNFTGDISTYQICVTAIGRWK